MDTPPCGEGACSRWPAKQAPVYFQADRIAGFAAATQPSGSKLPRHRVIGRPVNHGATMPRVGASLLAMAAALLASMQNVPPPSRASPHWN